MVPVREENDGSLVRVTLTGVITLAELEAHFERMRCLLERVAGPVATVVDGSAFDHRALRWAHLGVLRRVVGDLRPLLRGRYVAEAFVSADRGVRRAVEVTRLFARPAKAHQTFASLEEAEGWARSKLRAARRP